MQKVLRKRVLRNLRKRWGRYLALCVLVILGVYFAFQCWLKRAERARFATYLFFIGGGFGFWTAVAILVDAFCLWAVFRPAARDKTRQCECAQCSCGCCNG